MTRYNLPLLLKRCHVSNPKQSEFPIFVLPLSFSPSSRWPERALAGWLGPGPSPPPPSPPSPTHPPAEARRQGPNSNGSDKQRERRREKLSGGGDKVVARVRQQAQIQSRLTSPLLAAETERRRPALIRRQSRSRSRSFPGVPTGSAPSCLPFVDSITVVACLLESGLGATPRTRDPPGFLVGLRSGSACHGASSEF